MKVTVTAVRPVAYWKWDTSTEAHKPFIYDEYEEDDDAECGICRLAFESCCPECKVPGDDCPLSECRRRCARCTTHRQACQPISQTPLFGFRACAALRRHTATMRLSR